MVRLERDWTYSTCIVAYVRSRQLCNLVFSPGHLDCPKSSFPGHQTDPECELVEVDLGGPRLLT